MYKRVLTYVLAAITTIALIAIFRPLAPPQALAQPQPNCKTFPDTGKTVCGRFLEYWNTQGGLAQQGFPI